MSDPQDRPGFFLPSVSGFRQVRKEGRLFSSERNARRQAAQVGIEATDRLRFRFKKNRVDSPGNLGTVDPRVKPNEARREDSLGFWFIRSRKAKPWQGFPQTSLGLCKHDAIFSSSFRHVQSLISPAK